MVAFSSPVFSSVDLKLVVLRFSLFDNRSRPCYYYYHYTITGSAQPHSHTIDAVNS
ncbi:hypothetical protein EI94DRAFT_1748469, partial [Lactarius quietus]